MFSLPSIAQSPETLPASAPAAPEGGTRRRLANAAAAVTIFVGPSTQSVRAAGLTQDFDRPKRHGAPSFFKTLRLYFAAPLFAENILHFSF
jgi:hypothetical protein